MHSRNFAGTIESSLRTCRRPLSMSQAAIPKTEAARLEALRQYDILDSIPERGYDDITAIAAEICDTPMALVSFVDRDRQWFKSRVGIDARETPRDIAFCAHAILEPESPLVIEDATRDPRFANNPLVTGDPFIRFYAGVPLVTSDGHAIGTLCVIDREPRTLDEGQLASLGALARQVMAQLELRRTVAELEHSGKALARSHRRLEKRTTDLERSRDELTSLCRMLEDQAETIERDLHRAEVIQRSLLPRQPPSLTHHHIKSLYRPGRRIGGDLFDAVQVGPNEVAFVIADAAGHGVSAAMLSVLFKHRLRLTDADSGRPYRPADALALVNTALIQDVSVPGAFVTAALCLLNTRSNQVSIASAGHPPLLWLHAGGGCDRIEHTGPALGLTADSRFEERTIEMRAGDRLLMYTDGLFEVSGDIEASITAIERDIQRHPPGSTELAKVLVETCGGREREDRDDVTLLLLVAAPGESRFEESREAMGLVEADDEDGPTITYAEGDAATFVCLDGRVCWTHGQVLLDAAGSVIDSGRTLIVDLSGCTHMDSTILGTLHELAERSESQGATMVIQNAAPDLQKAFDELSMEAVLCRVSDAAQPIPEPRTVLALPETDSRRQQQRLLKAHEVLARLSAENREEFEDVLKNIRSDIASARSDRGSN